MKVAIYLRVSSSSKKKDDKTHKESPFIQNPEVQLAPLLKICAAREWEVFKIYVDRMSGVKDHRPYFKELWKDARAGEFKLVLVWRFDRFARSTRELLNSLHGLKEIGIDFFSSKEAIDTSTATGKLMFHMMAAFAEFERDLILERIQAGLDYAREHGTKSGRPIGQPKAIFRRDIAEELWQKGKSLRYIAGELGVSPQTIMRAMREKSRVPEPSSVLLPLSHSIDELESIL